MYAITLRPQWAYAVARLGKDIENRTWPLPYKLNGTRIAIHAAGAAPTRAEMHDYVRRTQFQTANDDWKWHEHSIDQVRGSIVAVATVWPLAPQSAMPEEIYWTIGGSQWALPEYAYQWALADVRPLAVPVPCRGAQGFWPVPAPVERLIVRIAADGACAPTMHEV